MRPGPGKSSRRPLFSKTTSCILILLCVLLGSYRLDKKISTVPRAMPEGWEIAGGQGALESGRVRLSPGTEIRFTNLENYTGDAFEIVLRQEIREFKEIAIGIGKNDCNDFSVETSKMFSDAALPPDEIIIESQNNAVMYYENGAPIRRFVADLSGVKCLSIKSIGSMLYLNDFQIKDKNGRGLYRQRFLDLSAPSKYFFPIALAMLALFAGVMVISITGRKRFYQAVSSIALHALPMTIFAIPALFYPWGAMLFTASAVLFVLLRIVYQFKNAPFFTTGRQVVRFFCFVVGLVLFSLILPETIGGILRAFALVSVPLYAMVRIAAKKELVPLYNLWMILLAVALLAAMEQGVRMSPLDNRWKPMGMGRDFEKHDLLLWVPVDFMSEDATFQQQQYTIPMLNFRSGPTTLEKKPGTYRIVVMGGSNTWGDGIDSADKTFPAVMERVLNDGSSGTRFEVINAGVKGYSSLQVLVLLRHYVVNYHPDMVVFYILRNDLVQNWGVYTLREMYEMALSRKNRSVISTQNTLRNLRIYNGLTSAIVSLRSGFPSIAGQKLQLKPTKNVGDFEHNLEDMYEICAENGIAPVMVSEYQSADHALGYDYRETDLEKVMAESVKENQIPFLDANRHFYFGSDWHEIVLPHDLVHLNEEGHQQVGKYIARFLVESKLVPQD